MTTVEIIFKEKSNYLGIFVDAENNVHLPIPLVNGAGISADNTCQALTAINKCFHEGGVHASVAAYISDLTDDIQQLMPHYFLLTEEQKTLFLKKNSRLQQLKVYEDLLEDFGRPLYWGALSSGYPRGIRNLLRDPNRNVFSAVLSPNNPDPILQFVDPIFSLKRYGRSYFSCTLRGRLVENFLPLNIDAFGVSPQRRILQAIEQAHSANPEMAVTDENVSTLQLEMAQVAKGIGFSLSFDKTPSGNPNESAMIRIDAAYCLGDMALDPVVSYRDAAESFANYAYAESAWANLEYRSWFVTDSMEALKEVCATRDRYTQNRDVLDRKIELLSQRKATILDLNELEWATDSLQNLHKKRDTVLLIIEREVTSDARLSEISRTHENKAVIIRTRNHRVDIYGISEAGVWGRKQLGYVQSWTLPFPQTEGSVYAAEGHTLSDSVWKEIICSERHTLGVQIRLDFCEDALRALDEQYSIDLDTNVNEISIATQIFFFEANVYCRANDLSVVDFGAVLDEEGHTNAVIGLFLEVLHAGNVEDALLNYINENIAAFGLSETLDEAAHTAIKEKFFAHYKGVRKAPDFNSKIDTPHFDEFLILSDRLGIFKSHQMRICCSFADFLREDRAIVTPFLQKSSAKFRALATNYLPGLNAVGPAETTIMEGPTLVDGKEFLMNRRAEYLSEPSKSQVTMAAPERVSHVLATANIEMASQTENFLLDSEFLKGLQQALIHRYPLRVYTVVVPEGVKNIPEYIYENRILMAGQLLFVQQGEGYLLYQGAAEGLVLHSNSSEYCIQQMLTLLGVCPLACVREHAGFSVTMRPYEVAFMHQLETEHHVREQRRSGLVIALRVLWAVIMTPLIVAAFIVSAALSVLFLWYDVPGNPWHRTKAFAKEVFSLDAPPGSFLSSMLTPSVPGPEAALGALLAEGVPPVMDDPEVVRGESPVIRSRRNSGSSIYGTQTLDFDSEISEDENIDHADKIRL